MNSYDSINRENGFVEIMSTCQFYASKPFEVAGLASDDKDTPTGMKEDILLVSWLIVLLRTREGQVSFDWAHGDNASGHEHAPGFRNISMDKVMTGLQDKVRKVAAAISLNHLTGAPSQPAPGRTNLLLSTSSLSQTSEEAKDEGILHLEMSFHDNRLTIRPVWYSENMLQHTIARYIHTFIDTIEMTISNPDASIEDCLRPTTWDLDELWKWNHNLPPFYDFCMHEMISERARESPDKVAINSWDGDLTYAQIDRYSTFVAWRLKEMGVQLHDVIPLCFEKSRWTIVAVLATMKSGATFAMMDPSLPLARLQNMAVQVGAKMMVSSRKQYDYSRSIMPSGEILVLEADTFADFSISQTLPKPPTVPSSVLMYIIFTSGSTGTPKGVKIDHGAYTSSAIPRAKAVGYTSNSRVLDFASYAFDVSIDSMLLTTGNGGCLCIPSDEDRLNDINGVMKTMRVNYAGITPSVARILDPEVIASLEGLGLGGEAVSARDANIWGQQTRIIIGYGPCECTIGCTVNSSAATGRDYISIGPGNGAAMWIVNPDDHESLMPVGAVGELLVEGPIVGKGYLNDPEKTASVFIENPSWLVVGHKSYAGRRGRLYKTGDLGRYDPDGSGGIVFVGRKDTQVKLRGQRVELGEIESQLRARLPSDLEVVAEVIVPRGSGSQPTLVAFVATKSPMGNGTTDLEVAELHGELREALSKADADIAKVLPRYMVPNAYIPVNHIPVMISGKTDRKRLRAVGVTVDLRKLDKGSSSTDRELSDLEKRLRLAWSEILNVDPEGIRPDDNFFALGANSLGAMRLVSVCRAQGLDLSVVNTFNNPTLSEMATVVKTCNSQEQEKAPAFSMISRDVESACLEASQACSSDRTAVEDIYPCTPTQESLFTFSLKSVKPYVAQRIACIPSHINLDAWKKAWEDVVAASPILRTHVAQLQEPGLQQVVLKQSISWRYSTNLAQYLESDRNERMDLGQGLARYAIVDSSDDGKRYFIWTIHHVVYDGWSEPLILQQVSDALQGHHVETQAEMKDLVKYVRDTDEDAMQDFWRQELKGAVGPQFPRLPSRDFLPTPDAMVERHISLETAAGSPFTLATLIRGAWALVASQYTASDDVVFGETLTGRDIPLPGVENIVGPLVATVPIRVRINRTSPVEAYLQSVQQSILARTPYQHMGWQNIRKVSQDAQHVSECPTGLVIQPEPEYTGNDLGFEFGDVVREALHFNPYPLMLACGIRKGGFRICANFDSSLIEIAQMERILAQFETACLQLSKGLSRQVKEITCLPETELNRIWEWNRTPPLSLDESSGKLRADASIQQGMSYPRAVIPWVCDARNPSLLSPIGCVGELWLEGPFLTGEFVQSPPWLLAGSSDCLGRMGRVQATGDMVQLKGDGSIIFIRRKDNVLPIQGHSLDIAELEEHFSRHLPPTLRTAAAVYESLPDGSQQASERELILFVENSAFEKNNLDIIPVESTIAHDGFETTICTSISTSLAIALKQLDKFVHDSLPAYMAPSTYVVVAQLPTEMGQIDRKTLNQLASKISWPVLTQLREGTQKAWAKCAAQRDLTAGESVLLASWAAILRLTPEQIDLDDNFFRLGGDSVLAMKLVSNLRAQGHSLSVADIFQHMRLRDAAKVLKLNVVSKGKAKAYSPFSTLGRVNVDAFLSEVVRPKLADQTWSIQDAAPVTDSQAFDIRATVQAPRTSLQYTMLYFDNGVDRRQLLRACDDLVKTHEILRTVFIENNSSFLQVVINDLEAPMVMQQADVDLEQYVKDLCMADAESNFILGAPFLKMFHVTGNDRRECLVIRLSHAQYDGVTLPRLLQDLEILYAGGRIVDLESFPSYIARISDKSVQTKAIDYWRGLLKDSSLSVIVGDSAQPTDKALFQHKPVNISQRLEEITTANLLTAAWALILARRLQKPDVTFANVTSGRNVDSADMQNVVGPCYLLTPVRVPFESHWTATDLLRFVQKQTAESAAHDFLGFDKISKQCTRWSPEAYFDSVVHHQDVIEEGMDEMHFAGQTCNVDILNPHGDAATPFKAVSFLRGGRTHVGVVGNERDSEFVGTILNELVGAVQELADGRLEKILLDV